MKPNETEYVLWHLAQHIETDQPLAELLNVPHSESAPVTDFFVDGVPILFPMSDSLSLWHEADGQVVFNHDLLRSAFHLLSGQQEHDDPTRDRWGRFPYERSLQFKTGTIHQATVCHYFEWLMQGIERQCALSGLKCRRRQSLPRLALTHDIDLAHYFTWRKTAFRFAQVLGLKHCDTDRWRLTKAAFRSLWHMLGFAKEDDIYWSFKRIEDNEAYLGYKSAWFFLPNDGGPFGPDYSLSDPDIQDTIQRLSSRGNRVGLHAPILCKSRQAYSNGLASVPHARPICRQHFLAVDAVSHLAEMQAAGIRADFSLGFSAHEGFRNGYCFPFHPYDHHSGRMMDIWEVPLAAMDTTLLTHRALSQDDIFLAIGEMLDEVRLFGGVFSLLWHNSSFDDTYHPGIFKFYEDLHSLFAQYGLRDFDADVLTLPDITNTGDKSSLKEGILLSY